MYGIDTLARDNRERVLSELSTTSIGGLSQIAKLTGQSNGRKDFAFEEFFFWRARVLPIGKHPSQDEQLQFLKYKKSPSCC